MPLAVDHVVSSALKIRTPPSALWLTSDCFRADTVPCHAASQRCSRELRSDAPLRCET